MFFVLMRHRPPRSTRTDTPFPYPTPCRSSHCIAGHDRSKHHAAARQAHSPAPWCSASSAVPRSDSGTTTRLHHGIATRLASGPASDACPNRTTVRSEEHTSELQSLLSISSAVFCLQKKKKQHQLHDK